MSLDNFTPTGTETQEPCKCIERNNEAMERQKLDMRIRPAIYWDGTPSRVRICVETLKGKLGDKLIATYCPFCGVKYPEKAEVTQS